MKTVFGAEIITSQMSPCRFSFLIPRPQGFLIFWRLMLKVGGPADTESRLFYIMEDIIHEIVVLRQNFWRNGMPAHFEPNAVIIPTHRRNEINLLFMNGPSIGLHGSPDGKKYVFGCEVLFSYDTNKIKVGYTIDI